MGTSKPVVAGELDARMRLKRAARRLFAERGFRNVTVREIATAAGQKNHAAVGYYFGTKESLAKEILVDGARVLEARRIALLNALEARGGSPTIRELVAAIAVPSAELISDEPAGEQYFNRFLEDLAANHPAMAMEACRKAGVTVAGHMAGGLAAWKAAGLPTLR